MSAEEPAIIELIIPLDQLDAVTLAERELICASCSEVVDDHQERSWQRLGPSSCSRSVHLLYACHAWRDAVWVCVTRLAAACYAVSSSKAGVRGSKLELMMYLSAAVEDWTVDKQG